MAPYDRDDDLIAWVRGDGAPRVRVAVCEDLAVVIGRGGKPEIELHLDNIAHDGMPLLKRPGGGCAVVLDQGNIIISAVLALPGVGEINTAFTHISDWLVAGLARSGVSGVVQRGTSDLALGNRKIGGSCIYRTKGLLYYSSTLLIDPDLDRVERYLRHPPREPDYRQGRNHREFMGRLKEMLGAQSAAEWCARLRAELPKDTLPADLGRPRKP